MSESLLDWSWLNELGREADAIGHFIGDATSGLVIGEDNAVRTLSFDEKRTFSGKERAAYHRGMCIHLALLFRHAAQISASRTKPMKRRKAAPSKVTA